MGFFWRGGGGGGGEVPNLAERNLGGPEEKPPEKFLKFLFLKTLQIHQI